MLLQAVGATAEQMCRAWLLEWTNKQAKPEKRLKAEKGGKEKGEIWNYLLNVNYHCFE